MLELIVLWEERMEDTNKQKRENYTDLSLECHTQGWHAQCMPVEGVEQM